MANEVSVTATLSVSPSLATVVSRTATSVVSLNDAANRYVEGIQSVTTSDALLNLGNVAGLTLGVGWFKNLDPTNYLEIRSAVAGAYFAKLKAGEACSFRFGSDVTAPYVKANTAVCRLEYTVFAD